MWCYRRMDGQNRNEEVFGRIGERRTLWKSLRKREVRLWGTHTLRHGGLLRDILEGEGPKYFDQIIGDTGCETFRAVKELARDRAEWRRVVASNES